MNSNQLTSYKNYDTKRIMFSKPEVGNIPGAISKLTFKRIRLATRNVDGTIGDLILATPPNLLCYGLQEQTDPATGVVNGYQFPLVLWGRTEPTEEERAFTEAIHHIVDTCKEHLIGHKDEIEKYDLEMNDLKKLNPLYYKMDKGKIVEGKGPMLYLKTMSSKKQDEIKIHTIFTNEETNETIDPMELMNKRCYIQGAVKFESLFIGNKISLQVKLFESRVRVVDTAFRSLLNPSVVLRGTPSASTSTLTPTTHSLVLPVLPPHQPGFTETGSLVDEDEVEDEEEEEEEAVEPVKVAPVVVTATTKGTVTETKKKGIAKKTK